MRSHTPLDERMFQSNPTSSREYAIVVLIDAICMVPFQSNPTSSREYATNQTGARHASPQVSIQPDQ